MWHAARHPPGVLRATSILYLDDYRDCGPSFFALFRRTILMRHDCTMEAAACRGRVLLVDDEPMIRETLAQQLEDMGFRMTVAAGGAEALTLLDMGAPVDVLVSDLSMPGMDGLALIREARTRRPDLPAILLTGYAGDGAALAGDGAAGGSFTLLRKPIEAEALARRIAALL